VLPHDQGYRTFLHLLRASRLQPDGTALVPLTVTELAARARAARGTVRQLLDGAAAQGWFEADAPPRHWRLSAKAVRASQHGVALELLWSRAWPVRPGSGWRRLSGTEFPAQVLGHGPRAPFRLAG
jgi:hypothetical protein